MENKEREIRFDNESALLTFLKLTKDGKYATIDPSSMSYSRVKEEREEFFVEEEYLYGMS